MVFGMSHLTRIWGLDLEDKLLVSKVRWILSINLTEPPYYNKCCDTGTCLGHFKNDKWQKISHERKRSAKILSRNEASAQDYVCDINTCCRGVYFDVIVTVVNCIEDRFTQAGYQASRKIEQLFLFFFNLNYESWSGNVAGVYGDEISHYLLSPLLQLLGTKLIAPDEKTIPGVINYMKQCSGVEREFFLEITILLRLHLISPVTNTVYESSSPTMPSIKIYYAAPLTQERLINTTLLSIHKQSRDKLDLTDIANMFCEKKNGRQRVFGDLILKIVY